MSSALLQECPSTRRPTLRADSLADSVAILMALTLVQPVVGFARGVLFCRWLDPEQLGQWDIALGFLTLAAPLVVLGVPGTFGRYVEYYRQRGQVKQFLRVATLLTVVMTLTATATMWTGAKWFSQLIFGSADQAQFVTLLALALGPLVAFGFVTELLTAFRLYRVVSVLQLLRSSGFLVLGATILFAVQFTASSVVIAYTTASLLVAAVGAVWLRRAWASSDTAETAAERAAIWLRVLPFAMWVWASNNLTNLFEIVDRYLIIHFSGRSPEAALELVGNYHSSRVVPLLIVIFATMLNSILIPHLSHAWESGRREEVNSQLQLALKLFGFSLAAGSAAVLLAAPFLFGVAFEGKYGAGLAVLPWSFIYCIWLGMAFVGAAYLWCREEARLFSAAMLFGLIVSIGLNVVLLPSYGLLGAVWACSAAKFTVLVGVLLFNRMLGVSIDAGLCVAVALPLSLLLGPEVALATCLAVGVWAIVGGGLLSTSEKARLATTVASYRRKLRGFRKSKEIISSLVHPNQNPTA